MTVSTIAGAPRIVKSERTRFDDEPVKGSASRVLTRLNGESLKLGVRGLRVPFSGTVPPFPADAGLRSLARCGELRRGVLPFLLALSDELV